MRCGNRAWEWGMGMGMRCRNEAWEWGMGMSCSRSEAWEVGHGNEVLEESTKVGKVRYQNDTSGQ